MVRRVLMVLLVAMAAMSCGGDEEDAKKGPGEACETDDECSNGSCVANSDGSKACADSDDDGPGGW